MSLSRSAAAGRDVRRVAWRLARAAGLPLAVLAIVSLGAGCGTAAQSSRVQAASCPARPPMQLSLHARPGGSGRLVPGRPAVVTVCGYSSAGRPAGSRVLRAEAARLTAELNGLRRVHKPINFMCMHRPGGTFLLRFRDPAGPGTDVLVQGSNCRFASNGRLLAFTTDSLQHSLAALTG